MIDSDLLPRKNTWSATRRPRRKAAAPSATRRPNSRADSPMSASCPRTDRPRAAGRIQFIAIASGPAAQAEVFGHRRRRMMETRRPVGRGIDELAHQRVVALAHLLRR